VKILFELQLVGSSWLLGIWRTIVMPCMWISICFVMLEFYSFFRRTIVVALKVLFSPPNDEVMYIYQVLFYD
jgi:hypothetical protein